VPAPGPGRSNTTSRRSRATLARTSSSTAAILSRAASDATILSRPTAPFQARRTGVGASRATLPPPPPPPLLPPPLSPLLPPPPPPALLLPSGIGGVVCCCCCCCCCCCESGGKGLSPPPPPSSSPFELRCDVAPRTAATALFTTCVTRLSSSSAAFAAAAATRGSASRCRRGVLDGVDVDGVAAVFLPPSSSPPGSMWTEPPNPPPGVVPPAPGERGPGALLGFVCAPMDEGSNKGTGEFKAPPRCCTPLSVVAAAGPMLLNCPATAAPTPAPLIVRLS
jgi:hypothetical protein